MIPFGETAVLLRFAGTRSALAAFRRAREHAPATLLDVVPGADSLLLRFADPPGGEEAAYCTLLEQSGDAPGEMPAGARLHRIPVVYDGPDLDAVAAHAGLHRDDVVTLHAGAEYEVAFVGFQPGFAYLSGLPDALRTPRRATPRPRVAAGSVGIGGEWTGIYPLATPGGWQLLGRSDVVPFDTRLQEPSLFAPGDRVRMVAR